MALPACSYPLAERIHYTFSSMTSPDPATSPTIVFSHANSFPAGTYGLLFEQWCAAGYTVRAIDKIGHDPHYPVTRDWPHLVRQLQDFVEQGAGPPVYLVGHSLGGYLSMMLASRQPALVRGVVVLDSPLLHGWKAASVGMVKSLGLMRRIMPSRIAAERSHQWPDAGQVRQHFEAKPKFAAFHPRVLGDYLHHGTQGPQAEGARHLSFRREVEAEIYDTMPHHLLHEFRRHPPTCPLAFIAGRRSRELRRVGLTGTRHLVGPRLSWIEGSHLYPFERPVETAQEVLQWLQQFDRPD